MRAVLAFGFATVAIVIASASVVDAQCAFVHPAKAKRVRASFVQAYFPCAVTCGPVCPGYARKPNGETREGLPSCVPAETFAQFSGGGGPLHPDSWMFGPQGAGTITLSVHGDDLAVAVKLQDVRDEEGSRVTATGHLTMIVRATVVDPVGGPMTVFDLPFGFDVPVENGVAKVKTTVFTGLPWSSLAATSCKSLELVELPFIRDPNGAIFATVGLYLP